MSGSYLFPEERVLDTYHKVWFESAERIDRLLTRGAIYSDSGWMVFTNMRIIYHGRKFLFPIDKIVFLGRHPVPGKIGIGEGYIRVDAFSPTNRVETYFFMGGGVWIWTIKRRSNELFGRMIAWNENVGRHTRI